MAPQVVRAVYVYAKRRIARDFFISINATLDVCVDYNVGKNSWPYPVD